MKSFFKRLVRSAMFKKIASDIAVEAIIKQINKGNLDQMVGGIIIAAIREEFGVIQDNEKFGGV